LTSGGERATLSSNGLTEGRTKIMGINLIAAWAGLLLGCIAGVIPGLFFHDPQWLGGYASWPRRMIRLGHISLFGIGLINLAAALTTRSLAGTLDLKLASYLLLVGAVAMPLVCYLSAYRAAFRHLFFIPATAVTLGIGIVLWRLLTNSGGGL
jgi:hypothetical protein